jgi:MFS family permease
LKSDFPIDLLSSFVGNFILPIFAILLPLLAYRLGADVFEIGLVGGVSSAMYAFLPYVAGTYSDRLRTRRTLIIIAFALVAGASALYGFVASPLEIILFRAFEGMGWAILWPTLDTVVSEHKGRDPRKSLTIFNVTLSAASVIGPIVGGILVFTFSDIRYAFVATTIMLLATLLINLVSAGRGRSTTSFVAPSARDGAPVISTPTVMEDSSKSLRIMLLIVGLIFLSAVRGILFTFLPSLGQSVGVPEFLLVTIAFAFGAGRTFAFGLSLRDDLRDRIFGVRSTARNVLVFIVIGTVGAVLPLIPDRTGSIYLVSMALAGIATGSVTGMTQVDIITKAEPGRKGRGAGILESSIGIGLAGGPILAGAAAEGSLSAPLLFAPVGLIVVIPVSIYLILKLRKSTAGSA